MLKGAIPLFRVAGIQVYLHFTWFIVAVLEFSQFSRRYQSPIWGIWEYLSLFAIVLLHEFGHAFACRQVGGQADQIMLWPLGGAAFVSPPQRPGAYLWTLAAGPLVNVILFPIFMFILFAAGAAQLRFGNPDLYRFISSLFWMNAGLLIFNILPIYPLDGGQIVRGLLWYWLGRTRSLRVASVLGFVGAAGIAILAWKAQSIWFGVIAFFIFGQAQLGWRQSQLLQLEEEAAKREAPIPATADSSMGGGVKPPPLP